MPTARSSTDRLRQHPAVRAVADVGHLLRFRTGTIRRRRAAVLAAGMMIGLTAAATAVPALVEGAGELDVKSQAAKMLVLVPTALAGLLGLAVVSSIASRWPRADGAEQAVAFPVSPTTDHLGALLMSPLNVAWLMQAWTLLGMVAYVFGTRGLLGIQLVSFLWIALVTAVAQALGWCIEAVRRGPYGLAVVRGGGLALAGLVLWLQLTHQLTGVLDRVPTRPMLFAMIAAREGRWLDWSLPVLLMLASWLPRSCSVPSPRASPCGVRRATAARREVGLARPPRPRSDLAALVRIDRGSVWRSVPMRRGMLVLAIGPGLVAVVGNLAWEQMTPLHRPGRLRRCAAVRRQRLVPGREGLAVAGEPAGHAEPGVHRAAGRPGRVAARRLRHHAGGRAQPARASPRPRSSPP
ncbi:MAG: hypothetical protein R2731_11020 [Nocardioides sp.]